MVAVLGRSVSGHLPFITTWNPSKCVMDEMNRRNVRASAYVLGPGVIFVMLSDAIEPMNDG